jgi:hypothetical protein
MTINANEIKKSLKLVICNVFIVQVYKLDAKNPLEMLKIKCLRLR